jgi:hypothetical protein
MDQFLEACAFMGLLFVCAYTVYGLRGIRSWLS